MCFIDSNLNMSRTGGLSSNVSEFSFKQLSTDRDEGIVFRRGQVNVRNYPNYSQTNIQKTRTE